MKPGSLVLGKHPYSYSVPPTPIQELIKVSPIKNVIGDVEIKPTSIAKALSDSSWVEAMQKELLQFKLQQGRRQEEGIDYEEFFAPVARIEAIRLFLAYASFMGFIVYQMDVKSAFLYGTIEKEHLRKLIRISFQIVLWENLLSFLDYKYKKDDGIFFRYRINLSAQILKKFNYTDVKSASTLVDLEKLLVKDGDADDVDVHLYRSMIVSLMYLTAFKPDIIYLKGKPTLGLWYSRDSPFELVAYTDSDYAGITQDRKSTIGGYLLTKGFNDERFQYLVSSIGMLNP
ncbi:uncharacterized mitochondrial protein-like protein [Tanacetum coccineum]